MTQPADDDLPQRIEAVLAELAAAGPVVEEHAHVLAGLLTELHGRGLRRVVGALAADDAGHARLSRLAEGDELVAALLTLHGLHPTEREEPAPVTAAPPPPTRGPLLQLQPRRRHDDAATPACELCSAPISEPHDHVVDLDSRALKCSCHACWLLFTPEGSGKSRFKAVGRRRERVPDLRLAPHQWDRLQIPVGMAFVFHNSALGRPVAHYPSPAGATESLLDLGAWDEVVAANPAFAELQPDVEAVLLRCTDDHDWEAFLAPIDTCYELVGLVRLHWQGFDGGSTARKQIDAFFEGLR